MDTVKVRYTGPGEGKRTMSVSKAEADLLVKGGLFEIMKTKTTTAKKEAKDG